MNKKNQSTGLCHGFGDIYFSQQHQRNYESYLLCEYIQPGIDWTASHS